MPSFLLSLVIFLPLAGAVLVMLLPRGEGGQHKGVALVTSLVTLAASLPLWLEFHPGAAAGRYAFEQKVEWAPSLGIGYHVDHMGRLLHALGWTCQKPEQRARERDETKIAHWRAHDWPRLKKGLAAKS